ncbi:hypothetical protein R3P38DRAFT_3213816 [Favolaschia claudopus]|uniref:Uncharacterized protein n=1 Tax=Favolaschia claudopus TaxID=2862362 RepID=A0AAW0ACW7_9AGAR
MSSDIPLIFTTIRKVIHNANETDPVYAEEIEDDIDAEAETLPQDSVYKL